VGPPRPRIGLLDTIEGLARGTREKLPVMISDCTDPYQPLEAEHRITRHCAQVLAKHHFPLLIVTKSNLVTRDIDIFQQTKTVVSMTVTTLRSDIAALLEPNAPSPRLRISALKAIGEGGIPTVARVDPMMPTINDDEGDFEELVSKLADVGVRQVTVSTLKPVRDFFSALRRIDPELHGRLWELYRDGYGAMGYRYALKDKRQELIKKLRHIVIKHGLQFASCREELPGLNTNVCDGTAYCRGSLGN
jgi:DNA repair photolyase